MFTLQQDVLDESVRAKVGANDQLFRIDLLDVSAGTGRGSQVISVKNPGGVSAEIQVDRGLDIGWADALGRPLAWRSKTGSVPGTRYNPTGSGWCETFSGGLLSTCGVETTGAPDPSAGLGLHGRIGHLPAENVSWGATTLEGEPYLCVRGDITESSLGGQTLRVSRTLLFAVSRAEIRIEDSVQNLGYVTAEHMYRHHLNFGYPLVDDSLMLEVPCAVVEERDSAGSIAGPFSLSLAPSACVESERVWTCWSSTNTPRESFAGEATITDSSGAALVRIEWDGDGFDRLLVWRDPSPGVNVLGLEPSTSGDLGKESARADGSLLILAPQETKTYRTVLNFLG